MSIRQPSDLFNDPSSFWAWWEQADALSRQSYIWPQDISFLDARGQNLDGVNWSNRQGRSMKLKGASLVGANLSFGNFSGSDFNSVFAREAKFIDTDLSFVSAINGHFKGAVFTEAIVHALNIDDAEMMGAIDMGDGYIGNPYNLNAVPVWLTGEPYKVISSIRCVRDHFRLNIAEAREAIDIIHSVGQVELPLPVEKIDESKKALGELGITLHREQPPLPKAQVMELSIPDPNNLLAPTIGMVKSLNQFARLNGIEEFQTLSKALQSYRQMLLGKACTVTVRNPEREANLAPLEYFTAEGGVITLI